MKAMMLAMMMARWMMMMLAYSCMCWRREMDVNERMPPVYLEGSVNAQWHTIILQNTRPQSHKRRDDDLLRVVVERDEEQLHHAHLLVALHPCKALEPPRGPRDVLIN